MWLLSESEKAAKFNGQFTYMFTKSKYSQVPLLDRSAPFMEDIVVTKEGVTKLLKGHELHPRVIKELVTELCPKMGYMAGFRAKVIHVCLSVVDSSFYYIRENPNITKNNTFKVTTFIFIHYHRKFYYSHTACYFFTKYLSL